MCVVNKMISDISEIKKIIENIAIKQRMELGQKIDSAKLFALAIETDARATILKDIDDGKKLIETIVNDVNVWLEEKLKSEFETRGLANEKEKRKKTLVFPKMENVVDGNVITAYPPEPSKFPHIGHAYACYINYLFAKIHDGKFIIRFEDTNPELVKKEYYDAQLKGYEWMGIRPDNIVYVSDHMPELYEYSEKMINSNNAYVCFCDSETTRENRQNKTTCDCRSKPKEEHLENWKRMLNGEIKKGQASLRLKGYMDSPQSEFRDPILMRINDTPHARTGTKYRVWPAYVFQNTLFDYMNGVTHRFRSKEFEPWKPVQKHIAKMLQIKTPQVFEYARVNLIGGEASGRKLRELVEKGQYGWDHPALTTLAALKRRGFLSESIIEFIDKMGISKTESTIDWSVLESMNRKMLAHYDISKVSAFTNALKIKIEDPDKYLETKIESGYIDENFENETEARIRHIGNVIRNKNVLKVVGKEPKPGLNILSFAKEVLEVKLLMPDFDNSEKKIFVDKDEFEKLKDNDIVQLQGIGFSKLDNKKEKVFVFGHK